MLKVMLSQFQTVPHFFNNYISCCVSTTYISTQNTTIFRQKYFFMKKIAGIYKLNTALSAFAIPIFCITDIDMTQESKNHVQKNKFVFFEKKR